MSPKEKMKDLTGKRYGTLLCLERVGESVWRCQCKCGKQLEVQESALLSGLQTSCGCRRNHAIDLTGQRFGNLVVLEPLPGRAADRSIRWLCRCDCGKQVALSSNKLRTGHSISCGCMQTERARNAKTFVGGTCIEQILSDKLPANNTSGCKGVNRRRNKWQASITLASKTYYLGMYSTYDEAVAVRKRAEEIRDRYVFTYYDKNTVSSLYALIADAKKQKLFHNGK